MSKPEPNWGELVYDHYSLHLGIPIARAVFQPHLPGPTIQVLAFDKVFPRCMVYGTLGLTHYLPEIGTTAEVLLCSDPPDDRLPYILTSVLFDIIQHQRAFGWGMVIGGIDVVAPSFVSGTGKSAIYFGRAMIFPAEVRQVLGRQGVADIYLATPISAAEHRLFRAEGARALEKTLEDSGIDPFVLRRPSVV